jgi:HSP90 family molecular chaperone
MQSITAQTIPVTANMEHLLKIISERLFNDHYSPIREYIANARDASLEIADAAIYIHPTGDAIRIFDRGCGMTRAVIEEGFTRVAGHYAHSEQSTVGMFGLGVLSAFMICDYLEVETRSLAEPHGWKLRWNRGESEFTLMPASRQHTGTDATLHLMDRFRTLAVEGALADYVRRHFSLFSVPIYIGNNTVPVNPAYAWFRKQPADGEPRLLEPGPVHELLYQHHKKKIAAAYSFHSCNGTRVLLGIPETERRGFGMHSVNIFSKGILVTEGARAFLPEHLSFVVAALDHPCLALQMDRQGFLQDEAFIELRDSMEWHICRFLGIVARSDQGLLGSIMLAHSTMLLAHARHNADTLGLFRENYRFDTPIGQRTWDALITELGTTQGNSLGRTLYVFTSNGQQIPHAQLAAGRGLLVVATVQEYHLLKCLADASGVKLEDSSKALETPSMLPRPFHELAGRLAPTLQARGVPGVEFFSSQDLELFPACFRIRSEHRRSTWTALDPDAFGDDDDSTLTIDALLLNTAHRIIEELAGRCHELGGAILQRAAEMLYSISVLQSPLRAEFLTARTLIVGDLIAHLEAVVFSRGTTARTRLGAKCFVALPYAMEFDPIWVGLQETLRKEPFNWNMTRADRQVEAPELLNGILQHLDGSGRFVADLSGLNPNVLLELGMMLRASPKHTLILCDEMTFPKLPTDLKGQVPMIYPVCARESAEAAGAWFERELAKYPLFISMHG